ncbi:Aste57867_13410 [Aphanomyces stellatus]|uniref:Aste57867_13410 protein n=1 Tax=Aphanomyces stellatus TaxID=120398 RepID=A0A485KYE0_9STRA|nr:hypothetical protein As57867_013360 [Aphanomyces stellatus]VFT90249.1 Aste57867_13410 [Aphanomyces stellatus]
MLDVTYAQLAVADADAIHALEAASYPADEAASLAQIQTRLTLAGSFFVGAFTAEKRLLGFVNGTLAIHREIEEETMSTHDPAGRYLCIHSVVVDPLVRRQGYAKAMLRAYVQQMLDDEPHVAAILLLAKPYLVQFYVGCGFHVTRLSPVVHGCDPWLELELDCVAARRLPLVQVDAFTAEPYAGNPAAVVRMSMRQFTAAGVDAWMQQVATENNLSETAFVAPTTTADPTRFHLRWFTPAVEVDLCGHATLATAFALFTDGVVAQDAPLQFETRSGPLTTRFNAHDQTITMDFPACVKVPLPDRLEICDTLVASLHLAASDVLGVENFGADVVCHVTADAFASLAPIDMTLLATIPCRGVIVTCAGHGPYDFLSRFFGPRCGVPEDPVTGSAHCALAPYWAPLLQKTSFQARQASHRPGDLNVELQGDRVLLCGRAVITLRGVLV